MESVHDILGYDINNGGMEVSQTVLKTTVGVAMDQGRRIGESDIRLLRK
jgi:hypothetical protein